MIDPKQCFKFENLERDAASGTVRGDWIVPSALPYFEGHFPGHPVLPAVAMVDGSLEFLRAAGLAVSDEKLVLKKAKFTALILPGMRIRLSAETRGEGRWDVDWSNREAWPGAKFESMCSLSLVV